MAKVSAPTQVILYDDSIQETLKGIQKGKLFKNYDFYDTEVAIET